MSRILSLCRAQDSRPFNAVILEEKGTSLQLLTESEADSRAEGVRYTNHTENSVRPESGFNENNGHVSLPHSGAAAHSLWMKSDYKTHPLTQDCFPLSATQSQL